MNTQSVPVPDRDTQVHTILDKSKKLIAKSGNEIQRIIDELFMMDESTTVDVIANEVITRLNLTMKASSSVKHAIFTIIHHTKSSEWIQARRKRTNRINWKKAVANSDHVASGRKGGEARIKQKGTPGGEIQYSPEEINTLNMLLSDSANRYQEGRYKGSLNIQRIWEQFTSLCPQNNRTLIALRLLLAPGREKSVRLRKKLGLFDIQH